MTTLAGCFGEGERERERERERCLTTPWRGPASSPHLNLLYLPKASSPNTITARWELHQRCLGGTRSFHPQLWGRPPGSGATLLWPTYSVTACASTSSFVIKPCKWLWGLNELMYTKCVAPCKCPQFRCVGNATTNTWGSFYKVLSREGPPPAFSCLCRCAQQTPSQNHCFLPLFPASSVRLDFSVLGTFWLLT